MLFFEQGGEAEAVEEDQKEVSEINWAAKIQ